MASAVSLFDEINFRLLLFRQIFCLSSKCIGGLLSEKERYFTCLLTSFFLESIAFLLQASVDADMSQVMNNNGPIHHDFVPHIARISKLMKTKVTHFCHY